MELRDTRWRYCRGCPYMEECPYGLTYEPDPPADRQVLRAAADDDSDLLLTLAGPPPLGLRILTTAESADQRHMVEGLLKKKLRV